jgi:hypothetical protein
MGIVTLKKIKKTDLLGRPSFKDAKTYFSPSLSSKTGERIKILDDDKVEYYAKALNLSVDDLKVSKSDFWRDYTFIMQGEKAELDDTDPNHQLVLEMLSKDEKVALSEEDKKNKPRVEYLLIREVEVTATKVARRKIKADAYAKFNVMSDDDLKNVLLIFGKNPKSLSPDKIKELVTDEIENNAEKFLKFIDDKNFKIKVFINDMVQEGIVRKTNSSFVFDGEMIAHDTESMIGYLKDSKNTNTIVAFKKMLNDKKGIRKYNVD